MTDQPPEPEPNSKEGLIKRARDMALALREAPSRSLARIFSDEMFAMQQALADLQIQNSLARDILLDEEFANGPPIPEDDGVRELPTDFDYETRVLLHKVKHRPKGEVYIVGVPVGGEFMRGLEGPPVKFTTHQKRVPEGNGWAARHEAGHLLADGITVHVTCRKGVFSVRNV